MLFVCLSIYCDNVCEVSYCLNSWDVVGIAEFFCVGLWRCRWESGDYFRGGCVLLYKKDVC